jgi:hypothetical protein
VRRFDGDALDAQRPYVDRLAHTTAKSYVGGDGFMNMSPVNYQSLPVHAGRTGTR